MTLEEEYKKLELEGKLSLYNLGIFLGYAKGSNYKKIRKILRQHNLPIPNHKYNPNRKYTKVPKSPKDIKYPIPPYDELLKNINLFQNKTEVGKIYDAPHYIVQNWMTKYGIKLPRHQGGRRFKIEEENMIVNIIKENSGPDGASYTAIKNLIPNVEYYMFQNLCARHNIKMFNQFVFWRAQKDEVAKNIDFYKEENINGKTLLDIAKEHEISYDMLKSIFQENNIPVKIHSSNKSNGELEIKDLLSQRSSFNCSSIFLKDDKSGKRYEIDCYIDELKFGVEYCGVFWHSYNNGKSKLYHQQKFLLAKENGIKLLTVFENEWLSKKDILCSMFQSNIGTNKKIHARHCEARLITNKEAEIFHKNNHINGYTRSSINIGLFHNNCLISCLSISKSRFNKNYEYEFTRFSSLKYHTVVGGLSKLFSYFKKNFDPESVVTFADLRFGEGKSYEKIGFIFDGMTKPNYKYYKKSDLYSDGLPRQQFQKHKLKNMKSYDENKTEFEIMQDEGYYAVFDCGNYRYMWKK